MPHDDRMTKKRIDRAVNRKEIRQSEKAFIAAFHACWADEDAEFANLTEAAIRDQQLTAMKAISIAARVIDELASATGESRSDVLKRVSP